jgi:hypothetical protein
MGPKLTAAIATTSKIKPQNAVIRQFQILEISPRSVLNFF